MEIGLLKYDFQFMTSRRLMKMFKVSAFSFHPGIAGDRLLGPNVLPPRLTGSVCHDFFQKLPSRAVARCGSADYVSFTVHA
jgi:hypothetical protein